MTSRTIQFGMLALLLATAVVAVVQLLQPLTDDTGATGRDNALLLGESAMHDGAVDVPLAAPVEFDYVSRRDIVAQRTEATARVAGMVAGGYEPSRALLGEMRSDKPWWGITGQFCHGPGERSIDGPSEESRFVLNPLLLVAAEFDLQWDAPWDREAHEPESLPLWCAPSRLTWWPAERRAEAVYPIGDWLRVASEHTTRRLTLGDVPVYLDVKNAVDFGYRWLAPRLADGRHMARLENVPGPFRIAAFIHVGNSCGYPGDCNNGSPYQAERDDYRILSLPAALPVALWKAEPADADAVPDVMVTLRFE